MISTMKPGTNQGSSGNVEEERRVEQEQQGEGEDRKDGQHDRRHPAFARQRPHLHHHRLALADHLATDSRGFRRGCRRFRSAPTATRRTSACRRGPIARPCSAAHRAARRRRSLRRRPGRTGVPIGSGISTVSRSSAAAIGWPARSPRTNTSSATGNCSCIFLRVRVALKLRTISGSAAPSTPAKVALISNAAEADADAPPQWPSAAACRKKIAIGAIRMMSISRPVGIVTCACISIRSNLRAMRSSHRRQARRAPTTLGPPQEIHRLAVALAAADHLEPKVDRLALARDCWRASEPALPTASTTAAKTQTRTSARIQAGFMRRTSRRGGTGRPTR